MVDLGCLGDTGSVSICVANRLRRHRELLDGPLFQNRKQPCSMTDSRISPAAADLHRCLPGDNCDKQIQVSSGNSTVSNAEIRSRAPL